ncbi:MAG: hypothetical protein LBH62_04965 [Nitrososphaerota archaeon]|uniref:hypothetical protein n=1 Tax=Candidatus Bathycorpusculum sp. TaxID=2994959 RepID=UPI002819A593|nr:hypothetical protein [Candidatus Termiticorpusculum sp.]MCL2256945.1 hypothetical protein [Candidatus Termiticorpusculum sp.]MCL2292931.1 hypothetical protein [Candidatus Termiticorpusculum sp.]MDR0460768.1 hypothetical protein [Nitrososphaerota archaeon]
MLLTTLLAESIKSGKITVSQNNTEALEITAQHKKIDVNAKDKEFIKDIISSTNKNDKPQKGVISTLERSVSGLRTVQNMQPMVKEIAEDLKREGITVTLSFKGDKVVTMGSEADSKFTRFLLGTKGVQINSVKKLVELGL